MKKPVLGVAGIKWLKGIHLIISVIWLGGAICMNILRFAWTPASNGDLYAVDHAIVVIDRWVVVPAALGALLTGLVQSWLTTWGFIKYSWVMLKWMATLTLMVYAPLFQVRWAGELETISKIEGLAALQNPVYLQDRMLYTLSGLTMISTLATLAIISVLKPWMKKDKTHHRSLTASPRATEYKITPVK